MIDYFAKRRMAFLIPREAERTLTEDGWEFAHTGISPEIIELIEENLVRQEDANGFVKYRGDGFRITIERFYEHEAIELVAIRFYGDREPILPDFLRAFGAEHDLELFVPSLQPNA